VPTRVGSSIAAAFALGGVTCFALSTQWVSWFPPGVGWPLEKAKAAAVARAEAQSFDKKLREARARGINVPDNPRPMALLAERCEAIQAEYNEFYNRPRTIASRLRWWGIAAMGVGVATYAITRRFDAFTPRPSQTPRAPSR
jgi:hypothetical protein